MGKSSRDRRASRAAVALGLLFAAGAAGAPGTHADESNANGWALNGTFIATSNGDWAQTNDVFHDEATVRSTWTIAMNCPNIIDCTGRVTSDAGWSSDIVLTSTEFVVKRDIPNWERCVDGRTVTGHQRYRFFPVNDVGYLAPGSKVFAGFDRTSGESGGCSLNDKLDVDIPFRLDKVE